MVDKAIREAIDEWGKQHERAVMVIDTPAFDKSIVGISNDGRLVYDLEKMIDEYCKDNNCEREEAVEWIEFNTLREFAYYDNSPIFITSIKELKELL